MPEGDQIAFYINAYNSTNIKQVLDHYPIHSPMDIPGHFDAIKHRVAGEDLTVSQIEYDRLIADHKGKRVSIDTFAQYFAADDGVNGSLAGSDAESVSDFDERNTVVARVVSTLHIDTNTSVALGLTGSFGTVAHTTGPGSDESVNAWAVDATFQ